MPMIRVIPNIEVGGAPALHGPDVIHTMNDWTIIGLPRGMASGRASIMAVIPLESGQTVIAESSLQVLLNTASILAGTYREQVERPGFAKVSEPVRGLIKTRIFERILTALGNDMTVAQNIAEMVMLALEDDTGQEDPV